MVRYYADSEMDAYIFVHTALFSVCAGYAAHGLYIGRAQRSLTWLLLVVTTALFVLNTALTALLALNVVVQRKRGELDPLLNVEISIVTLLSGVFRTLPILLMDDDNLSVGRTYSY